LTDEQLREIEVAFQHFDTEHTGTIPASVLPSLLASMGQPTPESELSTSGPVDVREVQRIMGNKMTVDSQEEVVDAFRVFDKTKEGRIWKEDLRHILTNLGNSMPQSEVDELIAYADNDGSGWIDYAAFVKRLAES